MSKVQQKRATNKKPAEKPVSDGIKRAAERAGIEPRDESGAGAMSPDQWEKAIALAEATGGPLYAEMARLSRRFDNELGELGHAVATSLFVLGMAGRCARSPLEVHLLAKRYLGTIISVQLDDRIDSTLQAENAAVEGGAS